MFTFQGHRYGKSYGLIPILVHVVCISYECVRMCVDYYLTCATEYLRSDVCVRVHTTLNSIELLARF